MAARGSKAGGGGRRKRAGAAGDPSPPGSGAGTAATRKGASRKSRPAATARGSSRTPSSTRADGSPAHDGANTSASARPSPRRKEARASSGAAAGSEQSAHQGELLPEGKLYYRIGEVADITGVKPHVLRYWETEFRWMTPPKSRSKQRLYRRKDIEMILAIKQLLYAERYTIAGARQRLKELGPGRVGEVLGRAADQPVRVERPRTGKAEREGEPANADALLARVRRVRSELADLRQQLASD